VGADSGLRQFSRYSAVRTTAVISPARRPPRPCCAPTAFWTWVFSESSGNLTDHYDPRDNTIYLSDSVYGAPTIAAVGVAAHEAGHAVQYAEGYGPVRLRSAIVPATQIGSQLSFLLLFIGLILYSQTAVSGGHRALLPDHVFPAGHAAGGVQRLPPGP
jgi:Zn-dependent membrane protease YugP